MHEFWTIPITNMTSARSQNYTNIVVGEHGIQHIQKCACYVVALVVII